MGVGGGGEMARRAKPCAKGRYFLAVQSCGGARGGRARAWRAGATFVAAGSDPIGVAVNFEFFISTVECSFFALCANHRR